MRPGHPKARKPFTRKRYMQRGEPMERGTVKLRQSRLKPKKRTPAEYVRIYHSRARVQWVKRQRCIAAGPDCAGPMVGAHTVTGGTGYKAGYATIVPACDHHHHEMHDGVRSFEAKYSLDLEACAAATEAAWQARQAA